MQPIEEQSEPPEVYEHMPWSHLVPSRQENRTWVVYLIAGALAAAALGALVSRSVGRVETPGPVASPPTTVAPVAAVASTIPLPQPPVTEADLLAVTPGQSELAAAARAEWFVVDYFSSGGNPATDESIRKALPEGARLAGSVEQGSSFVEWAATSRIEALGDGRYRSTVLFRTLVSGDEASYRRTPVKAVDVVVAVDEAGGTRVVDLPMPAEVRTGPTVEGWAGPSESIPDAVRDASLRMAGSWGSSPTVVEGTERSGGWRIVVESSDPAGIRWPLTVWLTESGEPLLRR
jgi:hypothetical protein